MPTLKQISESLATAFVAGSFDKETLIAHAAGYFFRSTLEPKWLEPLAEHLEAAFQHYPGRPSRHEVAVEIRRCRDFVKQWDKRKVSLGSVRTPVAVKMLPHRGEPATWKIPPARNIAELAQLLELAIDDLEWLTFYRTRTNHYHLRWHKKKGTPRARLIEIPKPLLKQTQRNILYKVLANVPVHENTHGFRKGKSIFDYVAPHSGGKDMVLKLDLKDFFPSIISGRIFRLFMMFGYPETVAGKLADLCTNRADFADIADSNLDAGSRLLLSRRHLPQGAPTSPSLANICAFRLDCRLAGLARSAGVTYTRYADDILFSGDRDFRKGSESFYRKVLVITIEEGFRINTRKTRFMPSGRRQSATGLVINQATNLRRSDFDRLKAILRNCRVHGPQSQNHKNFPDFRAHLEGRLQWASRANPEKARRLWAIFDEIDWK